MTKMENTNPSSNAELIMAPLLSTSPRTVLSALLMRDKGLAPVSARIQADRMLKGRIAIGTVLAAELDSVLRANA
jgi:hypothetical protein